MQYKNKTEIQIMEAKKMKKRILIITLTAFIVTAFASVSIAMCGNHHDKKRGAYHNHGYNCMTDLTDQEQEALRKERKSFLNETRELRVKKFNQKIDLEKELAKESPDSSKVTKLRKEIYSTKLELMKKKENHVKRVNQIVPGFIDSKFHHKSKAMKQYHRDMH